MITDIWLSASTKMHFATSSPGPGWSSHLCIDESLLTASWDLDILRSSQTSIIPWFPRNCSIEGENEKCRIFIGDFLLYPFKRILRAVSIRYRDLQRPPRKWGTKQNKGCYKFLSNFFQCPKENLRKESVVFVPLSAFQSDQGGWVVGRLAVEPTISHTTPHLVLLLRLKPVTLSTREESHRSP